MTSNELYIQFHILLNRNAKFRNVNVDKGTFVILFNREKDRWLSKFLDKNNSTDAIHDAQELYMKEDALELVTHSPVLYTYRLPENYFAFVNCKSLAEKSLCNTFIKNSLPKPKDDLEYLMDGHHQPSFEFEESLCNIAGNNLLVHAKDYKIITTYLSYYKGVDPIDMEGYISADNVPSTTKNPTLSKFYLEQILDYVVTEVQREWSPNQSQFQISKEREQFTS